jgi:uncharacterized membrane protein
MTSRAVLVPPGHMWIMPSYPLTLMKEQAIGDDLSHAQGSCWLEFATWFCALVGLYAAAILSAGYALELPVPCGGDNGCAVVAAHPLAFWWGVPVAYWGAVGWSCLLWLLNSSRHSRRAATCLLIGAAAGAAVSVSLLVISRTEIGANCRWCLVSGIMAVVFLLLVVLRHRSGLQRRVFMPRYAWASATMLSILFGIQVGGMQTQAVRPPVPESMLLTAGPPETLTNGLCGVGPADGVVAVVMFGDFWCHACRVFGQSLLEFQQQNQRHVRLVFRHHPLSGLPGHQFSIKTAVLAEICAESGRFPAFLEAVHSHRRVQSTEELLQMMEGAKLPPSNLQRRLEDPEDPAFLRVRRDMELAGRLRMTSTPVFVVLLGKGPPASAGPKLIMKILNSDRVASILSADPWPGAGIDPNPNHTNTGAGLQGP